MLQARKRLMRSNRISPAFPRREFLLRQDQGYHLIFVGNVDMGSLRHSSASGSRLLDPFDQSIGLDAMLNV